MLVLILVLSLVLVVILIRIPVLVLVLVLATVPTRRGLAAVPAAAASKQAVGILLLSVYNQLTIKRSINQSDTDVQPFNN